MEKITVSHGESPYKKNVEAYWYGPTVLLIYATKVIDSDEMIMTNEAGYRFKRKITGEANPLFFQFHKI